MGGRVHPPLKEGATMTKLSIALQIILGLLFLFSAAGKLTGGANDFRDELEVASWLWIVIGIIEAVLALMLLASVRFMRWALPAATGLAILMIGAIGTHIRAEDYEGMVMPIVLLAALAVIIAVRRPRTRKLNAGTSPG
jgi:putative oxidoreductase